jgi:hypothetical protein
LGVGLSRGEDRVPVPSAEAIDSSTKLVRDLFKDEYARKMPKDKLALAETLFKQAEETKDDPAARFVLYRETAKLAAEAGNVDLALRAIDGLRGRFTGLKLEQLEALFKPVEAVLKAPVKGTSDEAIAVTNYLLQIVDEAVAADDLVTAGSLAKLAESAAIKSRHVSTAKLAGARVKEIALFAKDAETVKSALKTLEAKPDDPDAALIAGKYYCFQRGDWAKGLPLLAAGSDAKLKEAAKKEMAAANGGPELLGVANAWYDLGKAAPDGPARRAILTRAYGHYVKVAPELTGFSKTTAEKRIEELETVVENGLHDELWTAVRLAVQKKEVEELNPLGGDWGRKAYRELAPNNGILIGFNYTTKKFANFDTMDFIQPIYLTPTGEKLGTSYGKAPPKTSPPKTVKAKAGFAVASMKVDAGGFLNGFSLTFMRIRGKGLNPTDSYDSPWVGGKQDGGRSYSVSDSRPVIGFHGKLHERDETICSIGFIVVGPKPKK